MTARERLLASCVGAFLLCLVTPTEAAPSECPQYYPGGVASDITRRALAAEVRELCFRSSAVLHNGVPRILLAAAEHLTRRSVQQAADLKHGSPFHVEAAKGEA